MRHKKIGRRLHRSISHRQSLLKNLSKQLIQYEQIKTTLPKAKELKRYIDKIITLGKKSGLHRRRMAFALLRDESLVNKVFDTLAKRYQDRPGGYTRLLKAGFRHGDRAPMAVIEFIDRDISAKPKGPKPSAAANESSLPVGGEENPSPKIADKKIMDSAKKPKPMSGKNQVKTAPKIRKTVSSSGG